MSTIDTQHFINRGYGWTCKHCCARPDALAAPHITTTGTLPRFFTEGEAEERDPVLSAPALARWRDDSHKTLFCPRCGVEEGMRAEG